MRFLIDAQPPPALARLLSGHGHVAEHVCDIGPGDASDSDLWRYAIEHDAVLVTKEFSRCRLGTRGQHASPSFDQWFEPLIEIIVELASAGNRLIELR